MTKERLLYGLIGLLFVAYTVMEYNAPEPMSWLSTFDENDPNPYGSQLLFDRMGDLFTEPPKVVYLPLDFDQDLAYNHLIVAHVFYPSEQDSVTIMNLLSAGRTVLIAAETYEEEWLHGMGLWTFEESDEFLPSLDSVILRHATGDYLLPDYLGKVAFEPNLEDDWEVLLQSSSPLMVSTDRFGGELILCTRPLLFTNYTLLYEDTYRLLSALISLIPDSSLYYNRYYMAGRQESRSSIRYFLSQPPLRWSVYLTMGTLALVIFFGSFRKSPVIPLPESNENATLLFAQTLGELYYREGIHRNGAKKLVNFFYTTLRERYYINPPFEEHRLNVISSKTGLPGSDVIATFDLIRKLEAGGPFSEDDLNQLYQHIRKFDTTT